MSADLLGCPPLTVTVATVTLGCSVINRPVGLAKHGRQLVCVHPFGLFPLTVLTETTGTLGARVSESLAHRPLAAPLAPHCNVVLMTGLQTAVALLIGNNGKIDEPVDFLFPNFHLLGTIAAATTTPPPHPRCPLQKSRASCRSSLSFKA